VGVEEAVERGEWRRGGPTLASNYKCAHQNRQIVFASQGNKKEII
jgi:hypothetical protein